MVGMAPTRKGAVKATASVAKRIVDYKLCVYVKKNGGVGEFEGLLMGRVEKKNKSFGAAQLEGG